MPSAYLSGVPGWSTLLPLWMLLGMAYAGLVTPGGRLIRRSARTEDLPFLFAAQFSLSHVCWLLAYPLAGWVGARQGMDVALFALTALAIASTMAASLLWPASEPAALEHRHDDLPPDHPHHAEHGAGASHSHPFVIDELHRRWPG